MDNFQMNNANQPMEMLSNLVTQYDVDLAIYNRKRYKHIIFFPLSFVCGYITLIIGFVMFIKIVRERKRLFHEKQNIHNAINGLKQSLSLEEYLSLKSRMVFAGRE